MEDFLAFPFEPLRTTSTTFPRKRISNTSRDSGVDSLHVLLPAMAVTADNSQPYLMPSTSGMNPPSGPLTPIQYFMHNSRKSTNKEHKYNRSQPDHLDPHSVLRTCTRRGFKFENIISCTFFISLCSYDFKLNGTYWFSTRLSVIYFIPDHLDEVSQSLSKRHLARSVPTDWHGLNYFFSTSYQSVLELLYQYRLGICYAIPS